MKPLNMPHVKYNKYRLNIPYPKSRAVSDFQAFGWDMLFNFGREGTGD